MTKPILLSDLQVPLDLNFSTVGPQVELNRYISRGCCLTWLPQADICKYLHARLYS